ncbi:heat-inducible transcriptional repressor HrcA [Bacillota bacterium Meth-B3]|nr:heat-inducible transcriptional repressor HrcA [Christensenellaceae bacterium]MEA5064589.1 heat-inducible transcriptional repressor HrcA [Eubacteriales bacterium]MEA5067774.1 heat-inducible transcriptional repressor HrcA [Christensenellaceae bacterium]
MRMDERKFLILQAIIDDYIMTAVPVGSRTISRKQGVGFSPATIRNEMSDLEELGYLDQPHTSSGRVPSPKAYRLYVDHLLKVSEVGREDAERISAYLHQRATQVEQVIKRAAQVLSDITQYTALVTAPEVEALRIVRVQLVPVSASKALVIVVTSAGLIKDAVIRVPEALGSHHLYELSQMLTNQLHGLSLSEVRRRFAELFVGMKENRRLLAGVLEVIENRLEDEAKGEVMVGGSANLLSHPEYADVEKAKHFLSVLESREKLYPLLKQAGAMEFTIRIGPENDLPELSECSLVTVGYHMGKQAGGTIGIIGPTRMDYGRVLSVLSYMGRMITEMLSEN